MTTKRVLDGRDKRAAAFNYEVAFGDVAAFCGTCQAVSVRHADAVQGKAVQQKIDETITPLIKRYYPQLKSIAMRLIPTVANID